MENENDAIWIPSKDRIEETLSGELIILLRGTHPDLRELAFTAWIRDNFAVLWYIGEKRTGFLIMKVATDVGLKNTSQGYVKRNQEENDH